MEEVEAICDEIAIIDHGRVVARDKTSALLQQGASKLLLLRFAKELSAVALQALSRWQPKAEHARLYELQVHDADELNEVLAACRLHQASVEQIQFGVSRLERIYLSLLQGEERSA
jgi:ABC-2 type transport system ATP-binding protein